MDLVLLTIALVLESLVVGIAVGRWWLIVAAPVAVFAAGMLLSLAASPDVGEMGSLREWVQVYTVLVTVLVAISAVIGTLLAPRRRRS
jgi:hypothetical protein